MSAERPTPETQKARFKAGWVAEDMKVVYPEFAERLERERDEARDLAMRWKSVAVQFRTCIGPAAMAEACRAFDALRLEVEP